MREILFRGKRVDNGEWVEGFLILKNGRAGIVRLRVPELTKETADEFIKGYRCFDVIPETVGQYTGLTDKNGKKIFEGDICSFSIFHHDGSDTQYKGVVTYSGSRYMLWHGKDDEYWGADGGFDLDLTVSCDDEFEVIGNIHDNPDLLRGGDNGEKV